MEYILNIPEGQFREMEKIRYVNFVNVYFEYIADEEAYAAMSFEDYYETKTGKQIFLRELTTLGYIVDDILDLIDENGEEMSYEFFEDESERIINKYVMTNYEPEDIDDEFEDEIAEISENVEEDVIEKSVNDKHLEENDASETKEEENTEDTENTEDEGIGKGGLTIEL
ncbi:MAG: hypothetical protein E7G36_00045 [Peptoniphilus rhinitidis]|uniref:hypothetical protein n=1 Tax=Peptoniphilus rhinitidis TaxID=1175452 RepID=UPI002900C9F3|nr:hypothetical protein [Peptoniphilus rhinitidis]MDU2109055.1 hypothetical protein [Peptoniphilus lacydonensis]MDU3750093.1 hypothetical protein [Peptoniphilus rhinitidis]